jgi:hypothetical protein
MTIKQQGGVFGRNPTFNNVTAEGTTSLDGPVVINESGADVDFRVESDTQQNALFVDGTNGHVGVGIANPPYNLVVSNGGAEGLEIGPGYLGGRTLFQNYNRATGQYVASWEYASEYVWNIGGTEKMRLNTSGNLAFASGQGVTTSGATDLGLGTNGNVDDAVLDTANNFLVGMSSIPIAGDANSIQVNGPGPQFRIFNTTAGTGQSYKIQMTEFGTLFIANASTDGVYMTYGATSWTSTSDINEKNVTGRIEDGLAKINTLTPATFTWKNDETNTPQVGLIAQEVQQILPEVVSDNGEGVLGIRYTEVIPLLVAAIQELTERLEALEGK